MPKNKSTSRKSTSRKSTSRNNFYSLEKRLFKIMDKLLKIQ